MFLYPTAALNTHRNDLNTTEVIRSHILVLKKTVEK